VLGPAPRVRLLKVEHEQEGVVDRSQLPVTELTYELAEHRRPGGREALLLGALRLGYPRLRDGRDEITMFTVPGYVGGELQQPVPRDLVAVMAPVAANEEDPPRWTVDFWVADVDAAVSKVSDAGGQVLAPPHDLTGASLRQAVVRDPHGAALTLTQPPGAAYMECLNRLGNLLEVVGFPQGRNRGKGGTGWISSPVNPSG
jgi:Glyoxalase-like domain